MWVHVRKAIMARYSRDVDNAAAAKEFLVEQGVVNADEVK